MPGNLLHGNLLHGNLLHGNLLQLISPEERLDASKAKTAERTDTGPLAVRSDASVSVETLSVTAPHPFFVRNRVRPEFVAAGELNPGDELFVSGHRRAVVVANIAENAPAGETFTTYNFEVEDFHTYFVGQSEVWVHNEGMSKSPCDVVFEFYGSSGKLVWWSGASEYVF